MGKIRYIGSKARIAQDILGLIGPPRPGEGNFVDVFSGTGSVSRAAALAGWPVVANDHLLSSATMTLAHLVSAEDVPFTAFGGYQSALRRLSEVSPVEGFVFREYTPSGQSRSGHERRYFTGDNGKRIDGIRLRVEEWHREGRLSDLEKSLLVADLLSAANAVANIAGTYGCFLRHWAANALRPLALTPRSLLPARRPFSVLNIDAFAVPTEAHDVAYLDPPYTKRQYAAYYHLLETITAGDAPGVGGVTGLRPWQEKLSPFCYKLRALRALERLVSALRARRVVLSYSSEGHLALEAAEEMLRRLGSVTVHTVSQIGRYRPNQKASSTRSNVTEYLVELRKPALVTEGL